MPFPPLPHFRRTHVTAFLTTAAIFAAAAVAVPVVASGQAPVATKPATDTATAAQTAVAPIRAAEALVYTQRGTLPILLTAPHGGGEKIPGAPDRTTGVRVTDMNTLQLAQEVAAEIERLTGEKCYVVAARFGRRFADANRKEEEGIENDAARPPYRAYHAQIRTYVDEIRAKWPERAILLDLHGQGKFGDTLIRGTQNGKTVTALLKRGGQEAVDGPQSILGAMAAAGYPVLPKKGAEDQTEPDAFDGGFTVTTYGSNRANGIDAIQIEAGTDLRRPAEARRKYARTLAAAVVGFYRAYLNGPPAPTPQAHEPK